jgi:predicted nucleotidyltransferase component of viral defense system
MSVSRERLRDAAAHTGFRAEALEKVIRLGEMLEDVFHHPILGAALALKGGTALNLAFGPPPRLSVDLDFNYVASVEREVMLRDRPEVEWALERLALGRGYRVQRSRHDHAGRKLYLGYRNAGGSPDRIEVDLNFLFRLPLGKVETTHLWQPAGLDRPPARLVPAEELAAGKLCALLDRAEPRDLYDVIRLPSRLGDVWRSSRLRQVFVALAGILARPLFDYGRGRFDRVVDEVVRTQLHPLLTAGDEPSAEGLRDEAWTAVAPLLDLSADEREYCAHLQAGDLRPGLLFPEGGDLADRVRRHPALLWKAENAGRHAAGQRPRARKNRR